MVRCQMNFKRLSLTDIKIDIKRVPKKTTLIKAMEEADVKTKWGNSSWGKKLIVQKRRAALNDFDRFKVMLAKIKVRKHPVNFFLLALLLLYNTLFLVYTEGWCYQARARQAQEGVHGLEYLSVDGMSSFWIHVGSAIR
ncbi:unnamed protein product [Urochloa decumbens]|uniref:Large ribosomal subunit protein eL14 domain-containing protein n=1 Tax=Urochloa decumbens TaxID=240449 RepID=A0ABC8V9Y8_9POAL